MENAARGAVELLLSLGMYGPVAVVCGKGNNAGDGFAMARLLHEVGVPVAVELVCDPAELAGDAAIAFAPLAQLGIPLYPRDDQMVARLRRCAWIVDALLGTGASGAVRPPFDRAIEAINAAGRKVLALDLPSGLDCDTGLPLGPVVVADHTATFVAYKRGFLDPSSRRYTGRVHVLPIGVR